MTRKGNGFVYAVLVFVAFVWGLNPPIMKLGLMYVPAMSYNAARMIVALIAVWIALACSRTYRPFAKGDLFKAFLVGTVGFFLFQIFLTLGVQRTTAGNTSLILALLPVSVAIINKVCKIEDISKTVAAGILATMLGVVLIVLGSNSKLSLDDSHVIGILILLLAQATYGYYTVFSRELLAKYSTYQVTAYVILFSTFFFCLISLNEMVAIDWLQIPFPGWASIIFSGLFPLGIGNFLWIWGLGKVGSTKASLYNNLSPVFAVMAGYVILGETFGLLQCAGAAVIFAGLYLTKTDAKTTMKGHSENVKS